MNKLATIVILYRFKEVTFYTVEPDNELPLGLKFLNDHTAHPDINVLMTWIKKIGNDKTAASHYFRQEKEAQALPPPIDITHESCKLRWYCLRINYKNVIVFNGGEKTTQKAQDCPNVAKHFHKANKLSAILWDEIEDGNIIINEKDQLEISDNYKFEIT